MSVKKSSDCSLMSNLRVSGTCPLTRPCDFDSNFHELGALYRQDQVITVNFEPLQYNTNTNYAQFLSIMNIKGMIYYFQKLVGVVTFLTKIQKSEGNSTTLKNLIQKLEGKPTRTLFSSHITQVRMFLKAKFKIFLKKRQIQFL